MTNLIPVLVCKLRRTIPSAWISSMPSSAPKEFLFCGFNLMGDASAAIACNEWNVDPIRSHSLVPILGAFELNAR